MSPTALYRSDDLRRIEAGAADQPLMQRAGEAAAELAAAIHADRNDPVLILAGPGNNGGDAFEVARCLIRRHIDVCVVFTGDRARLPDDAAKALQRLTDAGGTTHPSIPENVRWSLIVDGLFGIGLTRDIACAYAGLIEQAKKPLGQTTISSSHYKKV